MFTFLVIRLAMHILLICYARLTTHQTSVLNILSLYKIVTNKRSN